MQYLSHRTILSDTMKLFDKFATVLAAAFVFTVATPAPAQEAPDALVKRISQEVIDAVQADKNIQEGNTQRVLGLVEAKVLPFINFQRMTTLAAGRFWRDATPEQQKQLVNEFRSLLIYTYSGAIAQIKDQKLEFKPLRADPTDTEVEVRSQVLQLRGEPLQLNYRLEKAPGGWKIYDVNVLGAWLVETYKGNFAAEISRGGIDGLIKALAEKNKRLAANTAKGVKKASSPAQ